MSSTPADDDASEPQAAPPERVWLHPWLESHTWMDSNVHQWEDAPEYVPAATAEALAEALRVSATLLHKLRPHGGYPFETCPWESCTNSRTTLARWEKGESE